MLPDFASDGMIKDIDDAIIAHLATVTLTESVPMPWE
jgi:hypothetical protein